MVVTKELVERYLNAHSLSWSASTTRSERFRLFSILNNLEANSGPEQIYSELADRLSASSLKTLFIRIAALYDWAGIAPNTYREFIKNSPRLFRHAIEPRPAPTDLKGARHAISRIGDSKCRIQAESMLNSGLRLNEAKSYNPQKRTVIGKGSKPRIVFGEIDESICAINDGKFRRELKKVGLRPHDLRKILANELANTGADHLDLMRIFGWSNIQTASFYLQPKKDKELDALVKGVQKDG